MRDEDGAPNALICIKFQSHRHAERVADSGRRTRKRAERERGATNKEMSQRLFLAAKIIRHDASRRVRPVFPVRQDEEEDSTNAHTTVVAVQNLTKIAHG